MNMREIEYGRLAEALPRELKDKQQLLIDTLEEMVTEARWVFQAFFYYCDYDIIFILCYGIDIYNNTFAGK